MLAPPGPTESKGQQKLCVKLKQMIYAPNKFKIFGPNKKEIQ